MRLTFLKMICLMVYEGNTRLNGLQRSFDIQLNDFNSYFDIERIYSKSKCKYINLIII